MTKVTKSTKGWRECSQKLMSLSPIFSMPIFSLTEFPILHISCSSDYFKVTSIKTHPRGFASVVAILPDRKQDFANVAC